MISKRRCAIDGCESESHCKGYCNRHYQRWLKHGDATKTALRKASAFIAEVMAREDDLCIVWPFAKTSHGYGVFSFKGQQTTASRVVCILEHGDPPSPAHQAAHSCGNGHLSCVNRRHLSWKLPVENQADRVVHGTLLVGEKHQNAKLSNSAVKRIRERPGMEDCAALSAIFCVSPGTIWDVVNRKTWRHLP